jgi:hypothetical protein
MLPPAAFNGGRPDAKATALTRFVGGRKTARHEGGGSPHRWPTHREREYALATILARICIHRSGKCSANYLDI